VAAAAGPLRQSVLSELFAHGVGPFHYHDGETYYTVTSSMVSAAYKWKLHHHRDDKLMHLCEEIHADAKEK
jgi:hypothetical protein